MTFVSVASSYADSLLRGGGGGGGVTVHKPKIMCFCFIYTYISEQWLLYYIDRQFNFSLYIYICSPHI